VNISDSCNLETGTGGRARRGRDTAAFAEGKRRKKKKEKGRPHYVKEGKGVSSSLFLQGMCGKKRKSDGQPSKTGKKGKREKKERRKKISWWKRVVQKKERRNIQWPSVKKTIPSAKEKRKRELPFSGRKEKKKKKKTPFVKQKGKEGKENSKKKASLHIPREEERSQYICVLFVGKRRREDSRKTEERK